MNFKFYPACSALVEIWHIKTFLLFLGTLSICFIVLELGWTPKWVCSNLLRFILPRSLQLSTESDKYRWDYSSGSLTWLLVLWAFSFIIRLAGLQCIWAYSGHYRPTEDNFNYFLSFLEQNGVNLNETQVHCNTFSK